MKVMKVTRMITPSTADLTTDNPLATRLATEARLLRRALSTLDGQIKVLATISAELDMAAAATVRSIEADPAFAGVRVRGGWVYDQVLGAQADIKETIAALEARAKQLG